MIVITPNIFHIINGRGHDISIGGIILSIYST